MSRSWTSCPYSCCRSPCLPWLSWSSMKEWCVAHHDSVPCCRASMVTNTRLLDQISFFSNPLKTFFFSLILFFYVQFGGEEKNPERRMWRLWPDWRRRGPIEETYLIIISFDDASVSFVRGWDRLLPSYLHPSGYHENYGKQSVDHGRGYQCPHGCSLLKKSIHHLSFEYISTNICQASRKEGFHCRLEFTVHVFSSYAMLHAARKVFSNVKSTIAEEWSPLANESSHPISPANVTKIDLSVAWTSSMEFRSGIKHVCTIQQRMRRASSVHSMLYSCFPTLS